MKIFVTGGLGFIGSQYVLTQVEQGNEVVNYDLMTYAANKGIADLGKEFPTYSFVKGDIRNYNSVLKAMTGCDCVVNFAAESHVDNSINNSSIFVDTNVAGTQVLLEAARKLNIQRFLHVSTDEVYGDIAKGESKETDLLLPNNPYSASKVGAEALVRSYHKTYGMNVVITRCTNNYGPRQHSEKFIPLTIQRALKDQEIPVYGSGLQEREWIFVSDHSDGIHSALSSGMNGEIYNFGSGYRVTNLAVAVHILRYLGKPLSLLSHVDDRLGHDLRYAVDCSKSRLHLGFKPSVSFETGMAYTISWYADRLDKKIKGDKK